MRVFDSCVDLISETTRELFSRGRIVYDPTRQGKIIPESETQKELLGYTYQLVKWDDKDAMLDWARRVFNKDFIRKEVVEAWFKEMVSQPDRRKSCWWNTHPEIQAYFMKYCIEEDGYVPYEYGERILADGQLQKLLDRLKSNKYSRGAVLTIWNPPDIAKTGHRVPCTITYQFMCRREGFEDRLHMFLAQRSCDLVEFFAFDVWKALRLLEYVSAELGEKPGYMWHTIASLHAFRSEVPYNYQW